MAEWDSYATASSLAAADTLLVRRLSVTPPAAGTVEQVTVGSLLTGGRGPALPAWLSGLADRHYAAGSITCIGTSITAGSFLATWEETWPVMLQDALSARFPSNGLSTHGRGLLIPILPSTGITPDYVTITGSPTAAFGFGLNLNTYDIKAGGGCTLAYHLTGTTAFISTLNQPGGGTATYQVDSAAAVPFSTNAGSTGGGIVGPITLDSTPGHAHTLTITYTGGVANCGINGVYEYNGDLSEGIQVYNCGAAGSTAAQWAAADLSSIALSFSNVYMIELGVNDAGIVTPAAFQASLITLIGGLIAAAAAVSAPVPQFVLLACYQQTGTTSPPWSDYVAAMYNIAAARTDTVVLDLTIRMPQAQVGGGPYGLYYTDGNHLSPAGASAVADIACGFLSPQ